jgi:hypothetical protein
MKRIVFGGIHADSLGFAEAVQAIGSLIDSRRGGAASAR